MPGFLKRAADASLASSTGATAASQVPTPSIDPTFAPGKQGPRGVSPRQNFSRVNTGAPPQMDAGASEQKSMAPRGAEMLPKRASAGELIMGKMAGRPMLQDLIKAAMVDSASRVRVSEEARVQEEKIAGEKCADCGMDKHSGACTKKKEGSDQTVDGQQVEKLAGALDFIAGLLVKEGEGEKHRLAGGYSLTEHLQTSAPGVLEATSSTPLPDHKGQGVHVVPMHPAQQKAMKPEHGGTQMENNLAHPVPGAMIQTNYGKKSASVLELVRSKLAADTHEKKETKGLEEVKKGLETAEAAHKSEPENKEGAAPANLLAYMASRTKVAEDALNPAKISAGAAVPPETSAAGEPGGAPVGGAPQGPTGLVGSTDAARKYTKGQAYANRKVDLRKYFQEPALSAQHDSTLRAAFDNTGKAGTKFAEAQQPAASVKTAAARVLLTKLAEGIEQRSGTTGTAAAPGTV
jgi:hypothetical protein